MCEWRKVVLRERNGNLCRRLIGAIPSATGKHAKRSAACSSGSGRMFLQIVPQRVSRRGISRYGGAKSWHIGQEQGQPEGPMFAGTVNLQVPVSGNQPRLDGLDFGPVQAMIDEPVVSAANPARIHVPAARRDDQADWQQQ